MKKLTSKVNEVALAGVVYVMSSAFAYAANPVNSLPQSVLPNGQTALAHDGDWLELIQRNFHALMVVAGLLISSVAFLVVSKNVIGTYGDIKDNKATWGALGAQSGVGMVILALVIYLLTQARNILQYT